MGKGVGSVVGISVGGLVGRLVGTVVGSSVGWKKDMHIQVSTNKFGMKTNHSKIVTHNESGLISRPLI